ncbi:MAG: hypothetical protein WD034_07010, partial [Parvibaculum sp.]
ALSEPGDIVGSAMRLKVRVERLFSVTEMVTAVNGFYARILSGKSQRRVSAPGIPILEGAGPRFTGGGR